MLQLPRYQLPTYINVHGTRVDEYVLPQIVNELPQELQLIGMDNVINDRII